MSIVVVRAEFRTDVPRGEQYCGWPLIAKPDENLREFVEKVVKGSAQIGKYAASEAIPINEHKTTSRDYTGKSIYAVVFSVTEMQSN